MAAARPATAAPPEAPRPAGRARRGVRRRPSGGAKGGTAGGTTGGGAGGNPGATAGGHRARRQSGRRRGGRHGRRRHPRHCDGRRRGGSRCSWHRHSARRVRHLQTQHAGRRRRAGHGLARGSRAGRRGSARGSGGRHHRGSASAALDRRRRMVRQHAQRAEDDGCHRQPAGMAGPRGGPGQERRERQRGDVRCRPHHPPQPAQRYRHQGADRHRVELATRAADQLGARVRGAHRLLVGADGRHHLEGVGHRDDPGTPADLLARQSVRVARPVPALVVLVHRTTPLTEPRQQGGREPGTFGRVPTQGVPLGRVRCAWLVEQRRRDDQLAQVVHQRGPADPVPVRSR